MLVYKILRLEQEGFRLGSERKAHEGNQEIRLWDDQPEA